MDSEEEAQYRRIKYKKDMKRKDGRIKSLESIVRDLREKITNYSASASLGSEAPTQGGRQSGTSSVAAAAATVVRYVGRNDFIPEFDPETSAISIEQWIRNLESVANMHGWDERTLVCNCTSKLKGYAKAWYERQTAYDITWQEWKINLIKAFPMTKNKLFHIRELVNRLREPTEDLIKFYYEKLGIGMSCDLPDDVITEAIIGTLGDKLMEVGAVSAGCNNTTSLLKYLANLKTATADPTKLGQPNSTLPQVTIPRVNLGGQTRIVQANGQPRRPVNCFSCGQSGHKAMVCGKITKNKGDSVCQYCHKKGHSENFCYKKKNQSKHCSHCKLRGHSVEECYKRRAVSGTTEKPVKKIKTKCDDDSDQKYFKKVFVNKYPTNGFIDFGSSCNTMKKSYCDKLNLKCTPRDSIVIKGYGDASILPLGVTKAILAVDGVERNTEFYVVPDELQDFDILVGQPFTEAEDIVVVKTATQLLICDRDMNLELMELCDAMEKVKLYPQEDVILNPGVNKVIVRSDPIVCGLLELKHSEQRKPLCERDVVSEMIEGQDGNAIIKLINKTTTSMKLKRDECIARAMLTDSKTEDMKSKIGDGLTNLQKEYLYDLLLQFNHCFSGSSMELGNCEVEMTIKLTQEKVINYKPYRVSFYEREIIKNIVTELLEANIIEESRSSYSSPVLLVKKKDGGYRMCVDYRALNKITEKERYPMPVIQDLLDRLVDQTVYCCLDLANGYHQIKIAESSRPYTGFVTPDGHYQYRMMSFGLCNAPAIFQRAMNEILAPVIHKCAEVYIDDVIVWGKDADDCMNNLRSVLQLIDKAGIKLKRSKCSFLTNTVEYLGHEISSEGIRPSSHKVSAVKEFRTPRNVHEVRQFLGLASYFRKFIKGFATIARPLTKLTKKSIEWCWGKQQDDALKRLKEILASDPVLVIYHPDHETEIHTDASQIGLGGVLFQRQSSGELKVVAYASRQTTATEEKYHSFELEALAVVFSIEKFKVYVTGIQFKVVTDCSALRLAWAKRDLSPRISRWWLDLQEFHFDVEHRPGTSMQHVDALSRNPIMIRHIEERDLIDTLQAGDEYIQNLILNLKLESDCNKGRSTGLNKDFKIVNGCLCRSVNGKNIPVLPKTAKWHIMRTYHDNNGHLGLEKCLEAVQAKYWFPQMRKFVAKYVSSCIGCQFTKKPPGKQVGMLHPIEKVPVPFHTLHIDHLGPFCKSNGKSYILAIIDGFTKFVWLEAVASTNTKGAIGALQRLAQTFGHPMRIISDRGSAFTSKDFKTYCENLGIRHVLNAVASPRANGQVERLNRTILNSLTAHMGNEQKGWDAYLPKVQLGINSTVSQGTGKAPLELLCALRPRLPGEVQGPTCSTLNIVTLREEAAEKMKANAMRMKSRYDKGRRIGKPLAVGMLVMVERRILRPGLASGKLVPRYGGPYKITKILPHDRYEVTEVGRGKRAYKSIVARDKIKKWCEREETSSEED